MYDPTDEAIAAYLGQIGADSEVISKVITRSKVKRGIAFSIIIKWRRQTAHHTEDRRTPQTPNV